VGVPAGGWSLLLRVSDYGIDGVEMSKRLIGHEVAATAMAGWGGRDACGFIRFVFSNEPVERLRTLGLKVRAALEHG
jgi:aspartate/methionine/tyrosine aminotransferase